MGSIKINMLKLTEFNNREKIKDLKENMTRLLKKLI